MFLIIIIFPFINFILSVFFGEKLGKKGVKLMSFIMIGLPLSLIMFYLILMIINENIIEQTLWTWVNMGSFHLPFSIILDNLSFLMLMLVFIVSFFVHMFSFSYMVDDPHFQSFLGYLSLFTFFMVMLITSGNLLQLFMGWEGVGLCSYLLINFWYTSIEANKASIKAMVINKVGDLGLLLGLLMMWELLGGIDYKVIFCCFNSIPNYLELMGMLFFMGVMGKSAQIGLHTWLPDAMEGPTPVSALIHAATMVTAGVFLMISMSPFFDELSLVSLMMIMFGSLTCLTAAFIALPQTDMKKVMAYSTCSQLGYMVLVCGFYAYDMSLFHLLNHGFFKALLFLSAGSIIHINYDDQDMSKMGSIKTPITYICFFMGSMSLIGLPFLTGFFSKDLIIELVYSNHIFSFSVWISLIAIILTTLYSCKLVFTSFFLNPQNSMKNFKTYQESDYFILLPLMILSIFSIIMGYLMKMFILNEEILLINSWMKLLPLMLCTSGLITYMIIYYNLNMWNKIKIMLNPTYTFLIDAVFFNLLFNQFLYKGLLKSGFQMYKNMDNQILEVFGPKKFYSWYWSSASKISSLNSGNMKLYIMTFLFFLSLSWISMYY